ncbi:hypothetical protein [Pseudomonas syringae pv. coryli]|uniref:hypothetical protein n=1 Tax=Pseudomonas syringae pv. coryli TaxID=317659 RepID=UPI003D28BA9F
MATSKKHIAAGQRRSLRAIRRKLSDMSAAWGDVDGYFESELQQLADKIDEVVERLIIEDDESGA